MGQDHGTTRKGPWTEHEDFQLMFHVHMFGDRRWDFIAGVSGLKVAGDQKNIRKQLIIGCNFSTRKRIYQNSTCLKRTGKSCRLRWVNYLNPGLKRGKLAPHEERLVLELHSKFGNRFDDQLLHSWWSKIAQKLPGRTDNEIKNYWRTHMRKRAQEKKRTTSTPLSSSLSYSSSSSSICTSHPLAGSMPMTETKERSFYDTGGVLEMFNVMDRKNNNKKSATRFSNASEEQEGYCSMDDIWKDIELSDDNSIKPFLDPYSERAPLTWDICMSTNSWMTDGQEEFTKNTFNLATQQFSSGVVD